MRYQLFSKYSKEGASCRAKVWDSINIDFRKGCSFSRKESISFVKIYLVLQSQV